MNDLKTYGRRTAYKMKYKYRQDPLAFLVLWALFFSAVFLIFAFRGLIAINFMKKIDINSVVSNSENTVSNEVNNTIDNSISNSVGNTIDTTEAPVNNSN